MKTTMDSAGRIVIPAAARAELHLSPGQELEVRVANGGIIELEPIDAPLTLIGEDGLLVLDAGPSAEPLSDDDVRAAIERVRVARRSAAP